MRRGPSSGAPSTALRSCARVRRRVARRGHAASVRARLSSLTNVPDEARHRDTAVLDLRFAQEADGRRIRVAPELAAGEVERVIEAEGRVQLRTPTNQPRSNVAAATALSGRSLRTPCPAPVPPSTRKRILQNPGACSVPPWPPPASTRKFKRARDQPIGGARGRDGLHGPSIRWGALMYLQAANVHHLRGGAARRLHDRGLGIERERGDGEGDLRRRETTAAAQPGPECDRGLGKRSHHEWGGFVSNRTSYLEKLIGPACRIARYGNRGARDHCTRTSCGPITGYYYTVAPRNHRAWHTKRITRRAAQLRYMSVRAEA